MGAGPALRLEATGRSRHAPGAATLRDAGRAQESVLRILVVNPNTSRDMLALMLAEARTACRPGTEVEGVAAAFGVPQIGNRAELALSGHALLEAVAGHHAGHDAVVVGAFYQAFVPAVKELLPLPVIRRRPSAPRGCSGAASGSWAWARGSAG
jgi:hypothetical protein